MKKKIIILSMLILVFIFLFSIKIELNKVNNSSKEDNNSVSFRQVEEEYDNNTWAEFVRNNETIGSESNIEVHIKNQDDLNNYLLRTGNDLSGDMVWFENNENISFPTGKYTFTARTEFYLVSASGDIDFHNSYFLIGTNGLIYSVAIGDQHDRIYKNLTVYGDAKAELTMENNTVTNHRLTGRGYNLKAIKASNLHFVNLEFNNSKVSSSHVFDIMGCTNISFNDIVNRGDLDNWSAEQLQAAYNYSSHILYSEMIQVDMTGTNSSGVTEFLSADFNNLLNINSLLGDNVSSKNITISNVHSSSYKGYSGQSIIDKSYTEVTKPYASMIGSHYVSNDAYTGIKLMNNSFENVAHVNGVSNKLLAPIHFVVVSTSTRSTITNTGATGDTLKELIRNDSVWKNTDISLSDNTYIQCSNEFEDPNNPGQKTETSINLADFSKTVNNVEKINLVNEDGSVFKTYNGYSPEEVVVDGNIYVSSSYNNGVLTRKYRKPYNNTVEYKTNYDEDNKVLSDINGYELKDRKVISETVEELVNGDKVTIIYTDNVYKKTSSVVLLNFPNTAAFSTIINIILGIVLISIGIVIFTMTKKKCSE